METITNDVTTIVKLNAADYGLEESKAQEVAAVFTPMLQKMVDLEKEYNEIISLELNDETCKKAKELRLRYVRVRTGTAEIHKKAKAFYLNGGRFIDGWKNAQLFASQEKEKTLENIEKHFENLEKERIEKIRIEREEMLRPYTEVIPFALGQMAEDVWNNYFNGIKVAYEARIAAEKKAEEDRIAKEKADAEERERQRLENIRLKEEAKKREEEIAERERLAAIERKKQEDILAKERAKAEAERKERERLAAIERKKQEDILAKERAKAEAERKERERLAAELKAKEDAEKKTAEQENKRKAAEEKKLRLAPDKDKLSLFASHIKELTRPEVKSIEAADIASKANIMLVQVVKYIEDNIKNL